MRTYHALYKPSTRKNPRRSAPKTSRAPRGKVTRRKRNRHNPGIDPKVDIQIRDRLALEIGSGLKGKTGVAGSRMFDPVTTLFIAPGESVEFRGQLWEGNAKEWVWVNYNNVSAAFDTGKEKELDAAVKEAATSIVDWGAPAIMRAFELATDGKKGKEAESAATAAIKGFKLSTFTADGWKLPAAGKSVSRKLDGRRVAKVYAKKPPAGWKSGLDVVYYVEILDDDDKAIGGEKIGPLLDGPSVENAIASFSGLFKGEDDAIEANPIQRKRMESKTRRYFAKPNGILSGSKNFNVSTESLASGELKPMDNIVGIPVGDPNAAFDFGYNIGMLRGINTCRLWPDLAGAWERRKFRKALERSTAQAAQELAMGIVSGRSDFNKVNTPRSKVRP